MENYYLKYEKQIEEISAFISEGKEKPSLLMHACCGPCSSACIERLAEFFDITIYFYNPNIDSEDEHDKRYRELSRLCSEAPFAEGVKTVLGEYEPERFLEMARGREDLPERGPRCHDCYKLRMEKSYEYAAKHGFDFFTTTLSISPHKNSEWINEIGMELCSGDRGAGGPHFLFSDFKKKNGYKRSIELSKEYDMYRQDYCGCAFSRRDRRSDGENV